MRLLLQNFKITEFTSITVMLTIYIWNPITQDKGYEMKHSWQQLVPSLNYYLVFKNCTITYLLCLCAHNGLKYVLNLHFCKDGVCKLPFGAILLSCEQILSKYYPQLNQTCSSTTNKWDCSLIAENCLLICFTKQKYLYWLSTNY